MKKLLVAFGIAAALLPVSASASVQPSGVDVNGGACATTPPAGTVYYDAAKTITVDFSALNPPSWITTAWVTKNGGRPSSTQRTLINGVAQFSATIFSTKATNSYTYYLYSNGFYSGVTTVTVAPCPV